MEKETTVNIKIYDKDNNLVFDQFATTTNMDKLVNRCKYVASLGYNVGVGIYEWFGEFMFNLLDILRINKEKRAENPPNKEVEESDKEYVLSSNIVITKNIEENNC